MVKQLEIGNVIVEENPLFGNREYEIISISGNIAFTKYNKFNKNVGICNRVFEYGKRYINDGLRKSYYLKE